MEQNNKLIVVEAKEKAAKKLPPRVREFNTGIEDGRNAAARDYVGKRVDLKTFDNRDFKDHYGLGYELGYLTKLAEIAVY